MSYSTQRGMGARGVPEAVVRAFQRLADQQRGRPELTVTRFLHAYGGGPLWIVMHVGDLIWRMTNAHAYDDSAGQYDVVDKLMRSLSALQSRSPGGFRHEVDVSVANNACLSGRPVSRRRHRHGSACAATIAAFRQQLDALLLDFADEHRKLPVYNHPQFLAQVAAVAMGEQRFEDAETALAELLSLAEDDDRWVAAASSCSRFDAGGEPLPIGVRRGRGRVLP